VLQHVLVQRIERLYRLRLVYGLHLALFGMVMVFVAFSIPTQNAVLLLLLWLPAMVAHTGIHSLVELRERCFSYAPAPAQTFNYQAFPVDVYDEQGNLVSGKHDHLLPG
jgi:hypothetical protein